MLQELGSLKAWKEESDVIASVFLKYSWAVF